MPAGVERTAPGPSTATMSCTVCGGGGGGGGIVTNAPVTAWSASMVSVQVIPEQSPLKPWNVAPESAAAVTSTLLPAAKVAAHFASRQEAPAACKAPEPLLVMVNVNELAPTDDGGMLDVEPQATAAAANTNLIERMTPPIQGDVAHLTDRRQVGKELRWRAQPRSSTRRTSGVDHRTMFPQREKTVAAVLRKAGSSRRDWSTRPSGSFPSSMARKSCSSISRWNWIPQARSPKRNACSGVIVEPASGTAPAGSVNASLCQWKATKLSSRPAKSASSRAAGPRRTRENPISGAGRRATSPP